MKLANKNQVQVVSHLKAPFKYKQNICNLIINGPVRLWIGGQ